MLHNVSFQELQATLSYIYNGEVTVTRNFLDSFVKVAKTLQIKGIYDHSSTNKDPLNMKECAQEKIHMEESVPESYNNMKNPEIKSPISLIQKDSKNVHTSPISTKRTSNCPEIPDFNSLKTFKTENLTLPKNLEKLKNTKNQQSRRKDLKVFKCYRCEKIYKYKYLLKRHEHFECGVELLYLWIKV